MQELFSSPGMIVAAAVVFVVQGLSLLLLILNMHLFRVQKSKYELLLRNLGNEVALGSPGRFLVPIYCLATLVAAGTILFLFVFQPHII